MAFPLVSLHFSYFLTASRLLASSISWSKQYTLRLQGKVRYYWIRCKASRPFSLGRHMLSDKGVVRIKVRGNKTAWVGNGFQNRAWPRHLVQSAERLIWPISCLYSILKSWSAYINEQFSVSVTIKTIGGLCWQVLRCLQFLPLAG